MTLSDTELRDLLKQVDRSCRAGGFNTRDPEMGSAIGFAVFVAVRDWDPTGGRTILSYAKLIARRECLKTVAVMWSVLGDHEAGILPHRQAICFSDGRRFGCIPWGMLHWEALQRDLIERQLDHFLCDGYPEQCIAVDPDIFDQLIGGLTRD